MKSANVFLSQGFSHSDTLLFSEGFLLILIAQNADFILFRFPPSGFPSFRICAPKGNPSGLVLNLKSRKVKDFQIEVKIHMTHIVILKKRLHHICFI